MPLTPRATSNEDFSVGEQSCGVTITRRGRESSQQESQEEAKETVVNFVGSTCLYGLVSVFEYFPALVYFPIRYRPIQLRPTLWTWLRTRRSGVRISQGAPSFQELGGIPLRMPFPFVRVLSVFSILDVNSEYQCNRDSGVGF